MDLVLPSEEESTKREFWKADSGTLFPVGGRGWWGGVYCGSAVVLGGGGSVFT